MNDSCSISMLLLPCARLKVVNDRTWRSTNCSVGAATSQKANRTPSITTSARGQPGAIGWPSGQPGSACASACGLIRKEQVPDSPNPGRPDSRMQSGEVGPGLGEGNGERPELGPPETNPHARLPRRCQSPRGSCGQWKDIGPGAPRSALVTPPHSCLVVARWGLGSRLGVAKGVR